MGLYLKKINHFFLTEFCIIYKQILAFNTQLLSFILSHHCEVKELTIYITTQVAPRKHFFGFLFLNHSLQNFKKILKKCSFDTYSNYWRISKWHHSNCPSLKCKPYIVCDLLLCILFLEITSYSIFYKIVFQPVLNIPNEMTC